jgi:type IV secretory pathway VirB2 component (pilin)
VNQFDADVSQKSKAKSEGLAGLLKAIFDGLTGIWGIIAAVACVLICGALIFLLSPAGQESSVKLANAGASKIKGPF